MRSRARHRELNPALRVPTLGLDDGRSLAESNAILFHFADSTQYLPEDRFERQPRHRPDALEVKRRTTVSLDDAIRRIDDEADAVRERPVQIPEHGAEGHRRDADRAGTAGDAARHMLASESGGAAPAEVQEAKDGGGEANSRASTPSRGRTRGVCATARDTF